MQFLGVRGRAALAVALRAGADVPQAWAERPPFLAAARVVEGVLEGTALSVLAAQLDDGPDRRSALHLVREDVDAAVARALAPLDLRTDVHVCRSYPGGSSIAADPSPYATSGPDAGWLTTLRLVVPLTGTPGITWTLRSSTGEETPGGAAGGFSIVDPCTAVVVRHAASSAPQPWLVCRTTMRFPRRYPGPPLSALVG